MRPLVVEGSTAAGRLASLASGLCQDARIGLEVRKGSTWAWDPVRRVIMVPADDVTTKGNAYCAGILAHEVGHYFISRYPHLARMEAAGPEVWLLLNAIEDPRVEMWIRGRYPGTGAWLSEVLEEEGGERENPPLPRFLLFCFQCAAEEARGWRPADDDAGLPPEVTSALEATRAARRAYAEQAPDADLLPPDDPDALRRLYRAEVWPRLRTSLQRHLPEPREQVVRLAAVEAFDLAQREILPTALELLDLDRDQLAAHLEASSDQREAAQNAVREGSIQDALQVYGGSLGAPCDAAVSPPQRELAEQTLRVILDRLQTSAARGGEGPDGHGAPTPLLVDGNRPGTPPPPSSPRPRTRARPRPQPLSVPRSRAPYEDALDELKDQVDDLTRYLEEILRPRQRLGSRVGYPSGSRVSLPHLMQFEADPRCWSELWYRKSLPDRRDAAILLLVDLSGSMQGGKDHAALLGTVLLAETLARLTVPCAVYGFQDELIPFVELGNPLDEAARAAIGTMPLEVDGRRPGGHNKPSFNDDGPCLLEAAEHLLARREADRVLIAISDGLPEGRRSSTADLHRAVAELTRPPAELELIGVGLGPATGHVTGLYPRSRANVPVVRFAEEIGGVLEEVLTRTAHQLPAAGGEPGFQARRSG